VIDTLTTLTHAINSPPGQLAAGGVLAGIVWKFFERVEAVLTDQTKLEIAVWLVGVKVGQNIEPWPKSFATLFARVYGERHLSWRCFSRSILTTVISILVSTPYVAHLVYNQSITATYSNLIHGMASGPSLSLAGVILLWVVANGLPDYISLWETRYVLTLMARCNPYLWPLLMFLDLGLTVSTPVAVVVTILVFDYNRPLGSLADWWSGFRDSFDPNVLVGGIGPLTLVPAMATSIWLWLYAGSGFLLKAARRFDIGFDWFNRKFDIEKHPLQSIGLVAGALVAMVYWAAVIVGRVV